MISLTLLLGSFGNANVIVVKYQRPLNANVVMENGSPTVSAVEMGGFDVFRLTKNGTVKWSISGDEFIPVNADLLRGPFYTPLGVDSVASGTLDGGVLLGFITADKNGTLSPAVMKLAGNGSFGWARVYRLGKNIISHITSIHPGKGGILLSGYIENDTFHGSKLLPFLFLLGPNGTVIWAKVYHLPILNGIQSGGALAANGSYIYLLQDYSNNVIILRLDENGNMIGVNSVSGMKTVNSAASKGKSLYLLGTDENGTVLAKFSLGGNDLVWAKEFSIEFNHTGASCNPNGTNITLVSLKVVSHGFKRLLHVGDGFEVFPMPFELKLPLEGVLCNGSIFKQEAALKPIAAIFKVDGSGDLVSRKVLLLNSTYSVESFDYSNGALAVGMVKDAEPPSMIVEPRPLIVVGHFNDVFNLSVAKDVELNVTVKDVGVHLKDVQSMASYPSSEALNVSSIPVEPLNMVKGMPNGVDIKVYRTETVHTENSTTAGESARTICGPAFLVILAVLPLLSPSHRR